jgi:hypothetical protein
MIQTLMMMTMARILEKKFNKRMMKRRMKIASRSMMMKKKRIN